MTQTSKARTIMSVAITLAVIAATYAAQLGYATTTSDKFLSYGVAIVCGFFVWAICEIMVMFIPRMDARERALITGGAVVVMLLTFFFSTQWGVMALGGKAAMSAHLQTTVDQADNAGLAIYRQLTNEKNMAPQLRSLSQQFESLAVREAGGALTGMRGEGDVVATLRSTSQLFENAAMTIEQVAEGNDELYIEFQKYSDAGRKIMADIQGTEVTDGNRMRELLLSFGSNLSNINRVLVRMRGTSVREYVMTMSKNLASLALKPQEGTNQAQKDAIARLDPAVKGAQKTVDGITATGQLGTEANQTFAMMEPSQAIWDYAGRIKFAWGAAIAIDLIPFFFAFVAFAIRKQAEEDDAETPKEEPRPQPRQVGRLG